MEVYGALNANLPILSTIGIRTAFDVASDILKVDQGLTFAEKLDALAAGKHIREVDRERLATAVEAGNASAHCGWKPTATDLARIIHEKCAIKAKPLLSLTTMRMGCLMKFFAMKSLAQGFGGLGRFRAVR